MKPSDIEKLATEQLALLERAGLAEPPSSRIADLDIRTAYEVAAQIVRLRRERGEKTVGRKIGFTNQATWAAHGLNKPIWAHVYANTVRFAAADADSQPLKGMALPRIEPEIVFGLRSPASGSGERSWLASVEWLALGFELVDCHFPGWRFTPADGVIDFGLHATLIVGTPLFTKGQDPDALIGQLKTFRTALLCNGKIKEEGTGADVLGSPLLALDYLSREIEAQSAEPLYPGEVVTTGTLTTAPFIHAGETWTARVAGIDLPSLTLELT